MRKLLLLCASLALACGALAQRANDSVATNVAAQYRSLYANYVDDTGNVKAMLDLSSFYSLPNNPMHSYVLAVKYAHAAVQKYRAMVAGGNDHRAVTRLLRQGITIEVAQQRREEAILQASRYVVVSKTVTEAELDELARSCGDSPAMNRLIEKKKIIMACDKAQKDNTMGAYLQFVQRYPGTPEAYDCQVLMGKMAGKLFRSAGSNGEVDSLLRPYQGIATVVSAARERKSELAFDTVQAKGDVEELRRYLSRYPYTNQYETALDAIDAEQERQLNAMKDPREMVRFVQQNETSPLTDTAMARLRRMIVVGRNVQAAQLYFANFPEDPEYMDLYQLYYGWYAAEGNRAPLDNFAVQNPHYPYQQKLMADMAFSRTVDSMDFTQPYDESRYADYLKYVYAVAGKDMAYVAVLRTLQPLIAAKNWNAVVQRMAEFAPTFELYGSDLLERLYKVIDAPSDVRKSVRCVLSAKYEILNPAVTDDGSCLYYTRRQDGHTGVHMARSGMDKRSVWTDAGEVRFVNGDKGDIALCSLYAGGQCMLLSRGGTLWTAVREHADTWRIDEKLSLPSSGGGSWIDAFMLDDGSGLLLASDRAGGYNMQRSGAYFHGDTAVASDLYYIPRLSEGWGEPVNLGPNVNSIFCERAPVLSNDLKTLYFISDGHVGMGYGDIYYATRTDVNDWTGWGEAKNYGKEVNTGFDEHSLSLSAAGSQLLFSSNRAGSYGCYSVEAVSGNAAAPRTFSIASHEPARLQVLDLATHAVLAESHVVGDTLRCRLYPAKQYLVVPHGYSDRGTFVPATVVSGSKASTTSSSPIMLRGYFPSVLTDYEGTAKETPVEDLPLPAIRFVGATVHLQPEAEQELDNLASFLKHNKGVRAELTLRVNGRYDKDCFLLGRQRCIAVTQYLRQQGVGEKKFSIVNYGRNEAQNGVRQSEVAVSLHGDGKSY